MKYHRITSCVNETLSLAEQLAANLRAGDVIAYRGDLGAGKTAFTRGLAKGLGCRGEVCSPTFALVHEYPKTAPRNLTLYHFDMYRISSADDLYATGYDDYLESGGVLAIEWSENVEEVLPEDAIIITISRLGENEREIEIETERELSF